jgi:hypothetical protein
MKTENHVMTETGEMLLSFIQAMNAEDLETARGFVNDDMKFIGVMGSRDGADGYFKDMAKMKFKYTIKKVFADDGDVCLFYDIDMGGVTAFSCGWYHLVNGKIDTIRVLFDPRPVIEASSHKK